MDDLVSEFLGNPKGVSPARWVRLKAFLATLPSAAAAKLFAAVEKGKAADALPTAELLEALRGRIISDGGAFPDRTKTAERAFFTPFEDFFISDRRGRKRRARIARETLAPLWSIIISDAACRDAAEAALELDGALARSEADAAEKEKRLFAKAGEGLSLIVSLAEDDAAYRSELSSRLGGAASLHDLAEIAFLLPVARHLQAAQKAFARNAPALTDKDFQKAKEIYAGVVGDAPHAAVYVLGAMARRMSEPGEALRIGYFLARAESAALPHAKADAATIGDALIEDLETLVRRLERDADDNADMLDAPARFADAATFAQSLVDAAEREGDGVTVKRVEACRDIAAAALARYSEVALGALRRCQPHRPAGGSSRLKALRPDIDRPIDLTAEKEARSAVGFLCQAAALGEALTRADAAAPIVEDATGEARRYAEDLVAEIRAAEGEQRWSARKRMDATLRAAEGLLPGDEIALLKERANVAAVSA